MILEGIVTKVERDKSAITVKTRPAVPQGTPKPPSAPPASAPGSAPAQAPPAEKDVILSVKGEAPITLDGKKATLVDLKPGQRVKVTYEGNNASAIEARTK